MQVKTVSQTYAFVSCIRDNIIIHSIEDTDDPCEILYELIKSLRYEEQLVCTNKLESKYIIYDKQPDGWFTTGTTAIGYVAYFEVKKNLSLEKHLTMHDEMIEQLNDNTRDLNNHIEQLQSEMSITLDNLKRAEENIDQQRAEVFELNVKLRNCQLVNSDLNEKYKSQTKTISALMQENNKLNADVTRLSTANTQLITSNCELENTIERMQDDEYKQNLIINNARKQKLYELKNKMYRVDHIESRL